MIWNIRFSINLKKLYRIQNLIKSWNSSSKWKIRRFWIVSHICPAVFGQLSFWKSCFFEKKHPKRNLILRRFQNNPCFCGHFRKPLVPAHFGVVPRPSSGQSEPFLVYNGPKTVIFLFKKRVWFGTCLACWQFCGRWTERSGDKLPFFFLF